MLSNYFYYVIEFIGAIPTCVSILEKVPEAIAMGKAHLSIDYFAPVQKFFLSQVEILSIGAIKTFPLTNAVKTKIDASFWGLKTRAVIAHEYK